MTDAEFEERTKTRQEEIQAVSQALAILSSDDAHDTFTSTFNFVQVEPSRSSKLQIAASVKSVSLAASHRNSWQRTTDSGKSMRETIPMNLKHCDRFFEVSQKEQSKRMASAEQILYRVAKAAGKPRVATLATRMRLDGFEKVIKEVDGMVRQPQSQRADTLSVFLAAVVHRS